MAWLDALFTTEPLRRVFSDETRLARMLEIEAALARVEARLGVIPAAAAEAIGAVCRAGSFDLAALAAETATAGSPVIPVVNALRRLAGAAAPHVHVGATSQDILDSALVLQLREAVAVIAADLARVDAAAGALARAHRATPMAGRTWLQHAEPTTFGLVAAGWRDAVRRDRLRLEEWRPRGLVVQLGGAAGTLAALGARGPEVVAALAAELGLGCPALPWHTARDRVVELATTLGLATGTLGKIARDVSLLAQTEVAEVAEPRAPGRGGSSAMPQKQNPVGAAIVLAAATRVPPLVATMLAAMPQEHQRGLGWLAEWETLPAIVLLTGGAAAQLATVLEGLEVDAARMRANLEATRGQIFAAAVATALARAVIADPGPLVAAACRRATAEGRHLREVLAGALPAAELDRLFDLDLAVAAAAALVQKGEP